MTWCSMNMEHDVEWELAGETEVIGENVSHFHFVHHKSHMIEPHAFNISLKCDYIQSVVNNWQIFNSFFNCIIFVDMFSASGLVHLILK
jgi:hypothetical protein